MVFPDYTNGMISSNDDASNFQREEFRDDEHMDTLFMDCLNELEYFGLSLYKWWSKDFLQIETEKI